MNSTIIQSQGNVNLIEWRDERGLHRSVVPASIREPKLADLEAGVPYGLNFEDLPLTGISAYLRERGIWTEKDLQTKLETARAAINDFVTIELLKFARTARNGG